MSTPLAVAISSPFIGGAVRTAGGVIRWATEGGLFKVGCASTVSGQAHCIYDDRVDGEISLGASRQDPKLNDLANVSDGMVPSTFSEDPRGRLSRPYDFFYGSMLCFPVRLWMDREESASPRRAWDV